MEIWLIRHGTTRANLTGRFQGQLDYPLSSQGRREATLLAHRLSAANLEILFSSDLQRAWETAQIIARRTGLTPLLYPLLRECCWGQAEGLTRAEIRRSRLPFPLDSRGRLRAGLVGGESERKLQARARLFLKSLENSRPIYSRVAAVSHGRFINALLSTALGLKARQRWPFAPAPASLSVISKNNFGHKYHLKLYNDRCHLEEGFFYDSEGLNKLKD